jgi:hypothetical protein
MRHVTCGLRGPHGSCTLAAMRGLTDPLWKLQCRLNRRLPFGPAPRALARFTPRGASTDVLMRDATSDHARASAAELCVVITTHARVEPCRTLLAALHRSLRDAGLLERAFVLVLEDPSPAHDYAPVLELLARDFAGRFAFYAASAPLGKAGRWFGYQTAFDVVRALRPAHTLFLEDDAVLTEAFVRDALARFAAIDDANKAVLYLCRFDDDELAGRWVRFARRPLPAARVQLTQWFDLHAFLAGPRFFELLRYELFRPWPSRWRGRPARSSGVSEQFTRRLFGRGNVYQVDESLAFHGQLPSVLNADARQARPLDNHPQAVRAVHDEATARDEPTRS